MFLSRRFPRRHAAAVLAAALLAGCGEGGGGGPTPPPATALVVSTEGRLERGGTVTVAAAADGQPVSAASLSLTVTPADAAEVTGAGTLRLLRAGEVEVRATAGERSGTVKVTVAAPPAVVFDMSVGGNRDIYRVALDGGELARLTQHASDDRDPTVGGGNVTFVTFRHGNGELYTLPLAGGAETRVTTTSRSESAPALSADGQRLAYATDPSGVAKLWTAMATGSGAAAAAPNFGFDGSPETSPTWAPSGGRLAFVGTAGGSADIFQLELGKAPELLIGGTAAEVDPAWSADGQWVAFASTREGDAALFIVRVSDRAVTRLTTRTGTEAEPAWTRDGRLVYTEFLAAGQSRLVWIDPAAPQTVNVIPVQGGSPRRPAVAQ